MKLALFDFDGTLTTRDTMIEFIRFVHGSPRLYLGYLVLLPWLLAMKAGLYANDKAKMRLLSHFFGGWEKEKLETLGRDFGEQVVPGLMRPAGLETLRRHQARQDRVLLVSASLDLWTKPYFAAQGWESLTSEAEYVQGRFTGKLLGPNCHGPEKVRRIREHLSLADYDTILAYGDSSGDKEMLALAAEPHYKPFR